MCFRSKPQRHHNYKGTGRSPDPNTRDTSFRVLRFSHLSTREKKLASDVPKGLLRYGRELPPLQVRESREHYSAHHGQTFGVALINRILGGVMIASERRPIDDVN